MNAIRLKFARAFGTKNDCCQRMRLYFAKKFEGSGVPFLNRHVIEEHIDELFFLYLSQPVSIAENHERVFKMLYELLIKGQDLIINRKATK
jgi:glutathione synthase/RimK-type ligase-like ATP-grasp enzyme